MIFGLFKIIIWFWTCFFFLNNYLIFGLFFITIWFLHLFITIWFLAPFFPQLFGFWPFFITTYKCFSASKNTLTGYRLFVYICGMIGIKDSSTDLLGSLSWDDVVTVLSPLMRSLLKHEIYSQPQDTEDGNVQLKFYCHVLCVVLRNKR